MRIGEMMEFLPHQYKFPVPNAQDHALIITTELTETLLSPYNHPMPFNIVGGT